MTDMFFEKYVQYFPQLPTVIQKTRLDIYFTFLINHAMPMGFIGKAENEVIWLRHILDSILVLNAPITLGSTIMDLGTGAGLPGIPLQIMMPQQTIFFLDSSQKKIKFLKNIMMKLEIPSERAICQNASKTYRKVDTVLYRAFRRPLISLEYALYHLKQGGKVVYWRTNPLQIPDAVQEEALLRISELGYKAIPIISLDCPAELGRRGLCIYQYEYPKRNIFPRIVKSIENDFLNQSVY